MYGLQIERVFSAAHAIIIGGVRETMHGHDWRVRLVVEGSCLDAEGLLCDFHVLEQHVDAVLAPMHNTTLNDTAPFDKINPTAECVAEHIAKAVSNKVSGNIERLAVSVTEAPGCEATYRMELTQ
ncbi:MAG: 6-carboxytetrahydropterin synthase [Phycisphaerales bacterium]|nr:6-carboxytetrahydropterin synthase [Phycisphaerales bacterium]